MFLVCCVAPINVVLLLLLLLVIMVVVVVVVLVLVRWCCLEGRGGGGGFCEGGAPVKDKEARTDRRNSAVPLREARRNKSLASA